MNLRSLQTVCLLIILSSCKSLQQSSAHKNPSTAKTSSKTDPRFLDNVSINPGEKKSSGYAYTHAQGGSKSLTYTSSSSNIEKADWLQIKYAIMIDMPVEQLNNLPLLQQIDHWWGTRYCLGGSDEACIDCSAFTQTILRTVYRVDVPRTAAEQFNFAQQINDTEIREGDLVFFKSGRAISHVGLFVGNNKFVHASSSDGVTISDLSDSYWSKRYAGAGRVIK